jgi:AcrR family transcriptional regulator
MIHMNHHSYNKVPKSKVLRSALDLFSSKGYSETKMVDIARGSGLSVGALYLRFKNKQELCLELIEDQTKDFVERIENLPEGDPVQALRNYIAMNLEHSLQKRQLLSLFFKEYNLPFLQPLRRNFFRAQHKIISDILISGIKRGFFRPLDTKDTASMIFATIRGAILLKIIFGIGEVKKMGDSLFQLITNGIRKDAG